MHFLQSDCMDYLVISVRRSSFYSVLWMWNYYTCSKISVLTLDHPWLIITHSQPSAPVSLTSTSNQLYVAPLNISATSPGTCPMLSTTFRLASSFIYPFPVRVLPRYAAIPKTQRSPRADWSILEYHSHISSPVSRMNQGVCDSCKANSQGTLWFTGSQTIPHLEVDPTTA